MASEHKILAQKKRENLYGRNTEALRPIRPVTLVQSVAHRLTDYILSNDLQSGALLPPQRDLAELMGVSRPILRQAVVQLEQEGLVTVRQGSGMYVSDRSPIDGERLQPSHHPCATTADVADGFFSHASAFAVLEARMVIESEIAALAAQRATPDDIASMENDLEAIQAAASVGKPTVGATSRFHQSLAAAAHSPVLSAFLGELMQPMRIGGLRIESALPDVLQAEGENHRAILDAVRSGDASVARRIMSDHLTKAHQWEERVEQLRRVEVASGQSEPLSQ